VGYGGNSETTQYDSAVSRHTGLRIQFVLWSQDFVTN
jgi:hypothetical protein